MSSPLTPPRGDRPWPRGFTDRTGGLELLLAVYGPPKLWVSAPPYSECGHKHPGPGGCLALLPTGHGSLPSSAHPVLLGL